MTGTVSVGKARKGEVIEAVIAEACDIYLRRMGVPATVVYIHPDHPASVHVPAGLRLERRLTVLIDEAWAGRDA